jgi:hypothetical protein
MRYFKQERDTDHYLIQQCHPCILQQSLAPPLHWYENYPTSFEAHVIEEHPVFDWDWVRQ